MKPAYSHLAQFYDSLIPETWYLSWVRFARIQIKRAKINPQLIIDLACGTGRLTNKLDHLAPTIGVDGSPAMIQVAKNKFPKIPFYIKTFSNFKLAKKNKADVIICAFDSLNYLPTKKKLFIALSRCVSQLSTDGLLLFDINGELAFATGKKEKNARTIKFGNSILIWKNTFYSKKWEVEFEIHTEDKNGRPITYFEKHIEQFYSPKLITKMLMDLNMHLLGVYRDTAMHHVLKKNKRYFFVAKK